jgi:hypothetical protein
MDALLVPYKSIFIFEKLLLLLLLFILFLFKVLLDVFAFSLNSIDFVIAIGK